MGMDLLQCRRIYLSFPMTGYDMEERKAYADSVIAALKDYFPQCADFINPIELSDELKEKHKSEGKEPPTYSDYMTNDLKVIETCDSIVMCKEWDKSKGCIREQMKAAFKKINIFYINENGGIQKEFVKWKPYEPPKEPFELFGIECGPGWKSLYQPILDKVAEYNTGKPEKEQIRVTQVKEKFGGLRIYLSSYPKEIEDMIDEAEEKSYSICEDCGKPGKTRGRGWIYTLCDDCWNKMEAKKNKIENEPNEMENNQ